MLKPTRCITLCVGAWLPCAPATGLAAPPVEDDTPKPWIRRLRPTRHMVDLGVHAGAFVPSTHHDLYDPRTAPQKPLWAGAPLVGVRLGYLPLPFLGVEVEFDAMPTHVRSLTDDKVLAYAFHAQAILQLPFFAVTPFVAGGGGMLGMRSSLAVLGNDRDGAAHFGGGVKIHATRWLAVRIEARDVLSARAATSNDAVHHVEALAGLSVTLGRRARPASPPPDRDRDGVHDGADRCPDQVGPAPHGCPAKAPEPAVVPDQDGDGIADDVDRCPPDPETRNGYEDLDGCPDELPTEVARFSGVIPGIEFELRSAEITSGSSVVLDQALAVLQKYPDIRVEIVGHTDDLGTVEFNRELSQRRAEAVKAYLERGGISPERLQARGVGSSEPRADNASEEGRARNRRIEFRIVGG